MGTQSLRRIVQSEINLLAERAAAFQFIRDESVLCQRLAHLLRRAVQRAQRICGRVKEQLRLLTRAFGHPRTEDDDEQHAAENERDHREQQHGEKNPVAESAAKRPLHAPPPVPASAAQHARISSCAALAQVRL